MGRPKTTRGDLIVGASLQAIENDPSRDALSDYEGLDRSGLFSGHPPKAYTLRRGMIDAGVLAGFRGAFTEMAKYAFQEERWFVIDSTYFKTPNYTGRIQVENQHGKMVWIKVKNAKIFIVCGLTTGLPVAYLVTDFNFPDQLAFPIIFKEMMKAGAIVAGGGFIGDAGFNAGENFELVRAYGGTAFFDFDVNSVPSKNGKYPHRDEMLKMRHEQSDLWFAGYHRRNLIEWTNHAIKTVFKRVLRARFEHTREIEALALLLVYGLSLLPGLRLEKNMALPFVDAKALAFIDDAIAPKRKKIDLPMPSEEMYYAGKVLQFPTGAPVHVQRLG
jgi:hypothetical protein